MNFKKIIVFIYRFISSIYIFIFGRKSMQSINNVILSLSLNAKGYKNYGNFGKTGEKNFIKKIRDELSLSLDIGANVGKYTQLLLSETNTKIISFEPLNHAYLDLKKIEKKNLDRLKVFNIAIGEKDEILDLNFSGDKSEKASFSKDLDKLSFYEFSKNKKIKTRIFKLDTFFEENKNIFTSKKIDLIKIDTEGHELEVIKGAQNIIKNNPPKYIQFEFNWHQLFKNHTMISFLYYLQEYDLFQLLPYGDNLIKVDPYRPETNIFHLSNFVYIRKDISEKY